MRTSARSWFNREIDETNEKTTPVPDHVRTNLARGGALGKLSIAVGGDGRSLAASKHQRTNGCTPSPRVSLGQWSLNRSDRVILDVLPLKTAPHQTETDSSH